VSTTDNNLFTFYSRASDIFLRKVSSGVASYGALGHVPSRSSSNNFIFSSLWSRPKADSQILWSLRDQLVQMSMTVIRSVLH